MRLKSEKNWPRSPTPSLRSPIIRQAPTEGVKARLWLTLGAVNGFFAVALGAFAAHGLKGRLTEQMLGVFDKGVDYQGFHAVALLVTGLLLLQQPDSRALKWAGVLFLGGTLLFSGSLYLLALSGVHAWGAVTPFGGTAFLMGWALLGIGAWRLERDE